MKKSKDKEKKGEKKKEPSKKNIEYYDTPHNSSKWKGNLFSWFNFGFYVVVGLCCTLGELAIAIEFVAELLGMNTLFGKVSVSLGIIVISIGLEIGYTRLIEEEYLRNRKVMVFRVTAIVLALLALITVSLLAYTRYKGWQVSQMEQHVSAAASIMNEELSFQEQVGGTDQSIGRIKKEGASRQAALFKAFDPNMSSMEELQISLLKDQAMFYMYLFLSITLAVLGAVCFGIANLIHRVLKERVRTEKALSKMENAVADLHAKREQKKELEKMIKEENDLLDKRRKLISKRTKALADIHNKLGKRYGDKWVYEKQDILQQELERILKTNKN